MIEANEKDVSLGVLIDFHGPVYFADEEKRGVESDRARQQPEGHHHDDGISEIQQRGHELINVQLGIEIENAVGEHVQGGSTRDNEAPPPPMIVLRAQLEIHHDNADLRARDHQNDEHQEQETEQIVELILIDGREDKEQLDEARPEGQYTGHKRAQDGMHVPDLFGNLSRDLIGSHGRVIRLLAIAEEIAHVHQRQ